MALETYRRKRDFRRTPEPAGKRASSITRGRFVVQKHDARRLHYDLRLELDGVLKSWAVPKGPSLDPDVKTLAIEVEDHPLEYADFEGVIPAGEYGGGTVLVWDRGRWEADGDPAAGLRKGRLKFRLFGEKLSGGWALFRIRSDDDGDEKRQWLLKKIDDEAAISEDRFDVREERPRSVLSGRDLKDIAAAELDDAKANTSTKTTKKKPKPKPKAKAKTKTKTKTKKLKTTSAGPRSRPSTRGSKKTSKSTSRSTRKKASKAKTSSKRSSRRSSSSDARPARGSSEEGDSALLDHVRLTSPDKVLYPEQGLTKRELAEHYVATADWILPHIAGRPLSLVRCPRGRAKKCFYQKHYNESMPTGVRGVDVRERGGATRGYVVIEGLEGLLGLVQMGVLEIHPWGAKADDIEKPDLVVFDLDPGPDIAWKQVIETARKLETRLRELDLVSFVRTSGGKGLHVVLPITRRSTWDEVKSFGRAIAESLVRSDPDRLIASASKSRRKGKIFVDYLRNDRGATAIASYSTRARPGAPIATPVSWDQLDTIEASDTFRVDTIRERLARIDDPWASFFRTRQSLTKAILSNAGAA